MDGTSLSLSLQSQPDTVLAFYSALIGTFLFPIHLPAPFCGSGFQIFLELSPWHCGWDRLVASNLVCVGLLGPFPLFLPASQFLTLDREVPFVCLTWHSCSCSPIPPPSRLVTPLCSIRGYNFYGLRDLSALSQLFARGSGTPGLWQSLQVLSKQLPGLIMPKADLQCLPLTRHS